MKIFSPKVVAIYLVCSSSITGTLIATGNAPWSEISESKIASIAAIPVSHPASSLVKDAMEDGQITNMEYMGISAFQKAWDEQASEVMTTPSGRKPDYQDWN